MPLDARNFYRKVQSLDGFIVPAGPSRKTDGGRPARRSRPGPARLFTLRWSRTPRPGRQGDSVSRNSGLVVIPTALDLEYAAVRDQLTDLRVRRHPAGTRFEVGRISQSDCRVALGLVGKGNHPAAVLAERAMAEFSQPLCCLWESPVALAEHPTR